MSNYFQDKVFIVTGASSGIGLATAEHLIGKGAKVIAMARTRPKLEELREKLGPNLIVQVGDVSREDDCRDAVRTATVNLERLDGLIHNAGISFRALASEADVQVYRDIMEVNFMSMVYFYKYAREPIEQSKGHITAVSSMMGRYSTQLRSGYTASKHALQGYMNSIRLELMNKGVHVMVVSPGFVRTNISMNALTADGSAQAKREGAIDGGLTPEYTARVICEGIRKRKRDVYPAGFREKLGLFLSKWAPGFLDRMLLKSDVT